MQGIDNPFNAIERLFMRILERPRTRHGDIELRLQLIAFSLESLDPRFEAPSRICKV